MSSISEKISDAELEVMKVVWPLWTAKAGQPLTYTEIRSNVNRISGWENTTINTLVKRLVKKGALIQEKHEIYYYRPALSETEYQHSKTKTLIEKVYDGNVKGLISALLEKENITAGELDELQSYWHSKKKTK